jgi:hypothetical protein
MRDTGRGEHPGVHPETAGRQTQWPEEPGKLRRAAQPKGRNASRRMARRIVKGRIEAEDARLDFALILVPGSLDIGDRV